MCFLIFSVLSAFFVESFYFSAFTGQNKVVFSLGTLLHRVQQSLQNAVVVMISLLTCLTLQYKFRMY